MDRKQAITADLKALGYNSTQVSVRRENCGYSSSYTLTIRHPDVNRAKVVEIEKKHESVSICQASGEVLMGGNTYIDVSLTEEVRKAWTAKYLPWAQAALARIESGEVKAGHGTRIDDKERFIVFAYQEGVKRYKVWDEKKSGSLGGWLHWDFTSAEDIALEMFYATQPAYGTSVAQMTKPQPASAPPARRQKAGKRPKRTAATRPIESTDLKQITARFNCKCAVSGKFIPKGEICYYSKDHMRVVAADTQLAKDADTNQDRGFVPSDDFEQSWPGSPRGIEGIWP